MGHEQRDAYRSLNKKLNKSKLTFSSGFCTACSSSVVVGVYKMKTWFDHGLLSYDKFLKRHRPSRREGGISNMVGEIFSFLR